MTDTVADLLVDRLIEWGVDTVFSLPGDGINGIFESLRRRQDHIRLIQVRHEEAAAFAACGYAKFTRRLGVCLATSGPGGLHLLNGLYDAKCDGQPVLAITGHTFHDLIGTHYQQDVDLVKVFSDVAAYNERVMGPAHVCNVVDEAMKTAIARRTVAHITIPKGYPGLVCRRTAIEGQHCRCTAGISTAKRCRFRPHATLRQAADMLNAGSQSRHPGRTWLSPARKEILAMAEKLAAPIVKPLLGKAVVPDDHPYTTGGIGSARHGAVAGSAGRVRYACSSPAAAFPISSSIPSPGRREPCRSISIRPASGCAIRWKSGWSGQCWDVLRALLPLLEQKTDRTFLSKAQERMRQWNELMEIRGTRTTCR